MGINQFTDLNDDEFKATYLIEIKSKTNDNMPKTVATIPNSKDTRALQAIADIDWKKSGKVTGIRNQGKCGGCWAFAAIAVTESMFLMKNKTLSTSLDLSEQQLLDCGHNINLYLNSWDLLANKKNKGCNGGNPSTALKYIQKFGISTEN